MIEHRKEKKGAEYVNRKNNNSSPQSTRYKHVLERGRAIGVISTFSADTHKPVYWVRKNNAAIARMYKGTHGFMRLHLIFFLVTCTYFIKAPSLQAFDLTLTHKKIDYEVLRAINI